LTPGKPGDRFRASFPFDAERISFSAEAARQHVQEKATDELGGVERAVNTSITGMR